MVFDLELLRGLLVFLTIIGFLIAFAQPSRASRVATAVMLCGWFVFLLLNGVLWLYQVG